MSAAARTDSNSIKSDLLSIGEMVFFGHLPGEGVMINWDDWDGNTLMEIVMSRGRRFPELEAAIGGDGNPIPHDNPWHLESLIDHTRRVIDAGRDLSMRYGLSSSDHAILMVACMWHDAGKPFVRAPKDRYICVSCGRPAVSPDRGCPCGGEMEHRVVMGYHGHERVSASRWLFGNVSVRENLPPGISCHARHIIADHLWVGNAIEAGRKVPSWVTIPHILMGWADDIGRERAPFDDFDFNEGFSRIMGERV